MELGPKIEQLVEGPGFFRIREHMSIAKVDYAKNVMRYTEIPIVFARSYLETIEKMCFPDYYANASIKRGLPVLHQFFKHELHFNQLGLNERGDAKLKKSAEVDNTTHNSQ